MSRFCLNGRIVSQGIDAHQQGVISVSYTHLDVYKRQELSKYISELGTEGRLIQMQVEELISNVARDEERTIMDYENWGGQKSVNDILQRLRNLRSEDLLHLEIFAREVGYEIGKNQDTILVTRGYRLLSRIPRLPFGVIQNLSLIHI